MTCPPYCDICGGNLGHPTNGDWSCARCLTINEQLAPRNPRLDVRRCRDPDLAPPMRFEQTTKQPGDIVI